MIPDANKPLGVPFPGITWNEPERPNWVGHLITKYCPEPRYRPSDAGRYGNSTLKDFNSPVPDRLTFQDVQLAIKKHRLHGPILPYWYTTMPKEEKECLVSEAKSNVCFCRVLVRSQIGRPGRQLKRSLVSFPYDNNSYYVT